MLKERQKWKKGKRKQWGKEINLVAGQNKGKKRKIKVEKEKRKKKNKVEK